ncbi:DUF2958 domain-containing protein, partial [Candidatus Dependentiae bacterium]|nr:DUF2958 domain-containing protein [Candidatus Dependentiae bacterium]
MWNKPTIEELKQIPDLYAQESVKTENAIIYLHFFIGGCDWYISEVSQEDFNIMFGYANLNDPI